MGLRTAWVAGEVSSDLLASLVLRGMLAQRPDTRAYGIGGEHLVAAGFRADWPSSRLAVHGYWDALRRYRELSGIRQALACQLLAEPPDVFIGCDAPDFNLGLETRLRRAGIPTVHFISPSIWAWRASRIHKIRQAVNLMLCLFPFEPEIYERAGVPALFVGHPLASVIAERPDPAKARCFLGLDERMILAILPGSRLGEMRRLGPLFIETAKLIHASEPSVTLLVPFADVFLRKEFELLVVQHHAQHLPWRCVDGHSHEVIEASNAVLVASGTATLECALYKKPMVIAYKVARVSYMLMKHMAYLPWIGLPNILAREFLVPEFVQDDANPALMAQACLSALSDDSRRRHLEERFGEIHAALKRDTVQLAAQAILTQAQHAKA